MLSGATGQLWCETEVAFRNQYQEKIDAITNRSAGKDDQQIGSQGWTGKPILEGVKDAARWASEASGQGAGEGAVQSGGQFSSKGAGSAINRLSHTSCPMPRSGTM